MMDNVAVQWVGVAAMMAALDYVWAKYTAGVAEKKPLKASLHAVFIILLSGTVTISYTADPWLLLPAGVGAFIGTYIAVRRRR